MSARSQGSIFFTEVEYLALVAVSERRFEFIQGEIFLVAGASVRHIDISGDVFAALKTTLRGSGCHVYNNDMSVRIEEPKSYVFPDLSIVCEPPIILDPDSMAQLLNPVLILEILSPSTQQYDLTEKREAYQAIASLKTLIFIAQQVPRVKVLERQSESSWLETIYTRDSLIPLPAIGASLAFSDICASVTFA
ncbi:MAG: Uma2 family endonuclease [Chloroflexota bacterium]|nr:Uma2 family endonuclease [Chloroflexota bacterium]